MYFGSAPLILYSLPKIVTLSVSVSDPTAVLSFSFFRRPSTAGSTGPADGSGVHGLLEDRQLRQHLLQAPRERPPLLQQGRPFFLERLGAGLPICGGLFARRGLERPHLRPELIAFAGDQAILGLQPVHQIGDLADAFLESRQLGKYRAHARCTSAPPRIVTPSFDSRARTIAASASSTSRSVNVRSVERNSSA